MSDDDYKVLDDLENRPDDLLEVHITNIRTLKRYIFTTVESIAFVAVLPDNQIQSTVVGNLSLSDVDALSDELDKLKEQLQKKYLEMAFGKLLDMLRKDDGDDTD